MMNEAEIRVRYGETDQMGVVYYANYYTWFEIGRNEFFRELGFSYRALEIEGLFLPVVESHCKYKSPARYDDLIRVQTKLVSLENATLRFDYNIVNKEKGKDLAEGYTIHAFVDKRGRPVPLKKINPTVWERLKEIVER
jgi:acyl-CoA thioester hydrolase